MKELTCCFTGHRELPSAHNSELRTLIFNVIHKLFTLGYTRFMSGGAMGFDILAAELTMQLRASFPGVKLVMALPCPDQDKYFPQDAARRYRFIKSQADQVIYTSDHYFQGCMHKRNRYLAENSQICVCYLDHHSGGTYYTVKQCLTNRMPVINLAIPLKTST